MSEETTNTEDTTPTDPVVEELVLNAQDIADKLVPPFRYLSKDENGDSKAWTHRPSRLHNNNYYSRNDLGVKSVELPIFVEFEGPDYTYWLVEKQSEFTIEVGGFYRLKNNKKAYISSIIDNVVEGVIEGTADLQKWDLEGNYYIPALEDFDIAEVWKD